MRERDLVRKILKAVRDRGAYAVKVHGDAFQARTVDILICYRGKFIGIEAKLPGQKVTDFQNYDLEQIRRSGGVAVVAYSVEDAINTLAAVDSASLWEEVEIADDSYTG